jgi:hypothetical protein
MTEDGRRKRSHPTHDWGALATDPWRPIGAAGPEYREVMRRIWTRQGGSDETFERLMPPEPHRTAHHGR